MKELVCNYAPIRFLPYRETGEFVNVGVLAFFPEINLIDFRISRRRYARVKSFFPELDADVFSAAILSFRRELDLHRNGGPLFVGLGTANDSEIRQRMENFRCLIRRRESLVHFGEAGMLMTSDPIHAVKKLYERIVNRDFAQPREYQEAVMRRRLADWLQEWSLKACYNVNERIGGPQFRVTIPFVHRRGGRAVKVLKPLDLAKPEATNVYEHGDAWVSRMRRLKETGHLPDHVVFTVSFPESGARLTAANDIRNELEHLKMEVVPFGDKDRIRQLASVS